MSTILVLAAQGLKHVAKQPELCGSDGVGRTNQAELETCASTILRASTSNGVFSRSPYSGGTTDGGNRWPLPARNTTRCLPRTNPSFGRWVVAEQVDEIADPLDAAVAQADISAVPVCAADGLLVVPHVVTGRPFGY